MTGVWRLVAVALVIVAGCSPASVPSATAPSTTDASATPIGSVISSPATDACLIDQPPGPDDEPPASGEMSTTDMGGGRHATCLLGPPGVRIEGTAWCTWTRDRLAVQEVTGLPVAGEAGTIDVYLDLRSSALQISVTDAQGSIATYTQTDVPGAIRDDGSDGLMAFDAPLAEGSDPAPAGTPPRQTGTFRWQCAGPPPA